MVDIIIPTIDDPKYLDRALSSIEVTCSISQVFVYVINDGSSYDSSLYEDVINKHAALQIGYYVLPESIGPGPARNVGIRMGFNPWVCFLDCDDIYIDDVVKYCHDGYDFFTSKIYNEHNLFSATDCDAPCAAIHGMGVSRAFIQKHNLYFPEIRYGGEDTMFRTTAMALSTNYQTYPEQSYYKHLARPDSHFLHRPVKDYRLQDSMLDGFIGRCNWFSQLVTYLDTLKLPHDIQNNLRWNEILVPLTLSFMTSAPDYDKAPLDMLKLFAILYKRWFKIEVCKAYVFTWREQLLITFLEYFWVLQNNLLVFKVADQKDVYCEFFNTYKRFLPTFIRDNYATTLNQYTVIDGLLAVYANNYYVDFYVY